MDPELSLFHQTDKTLPVSQSEICPPAGPHYYHLQWCLFKPVVIQRAVSQHCQEHHYRLCQWVHKHLTPEPLKAHSLWGILRRRKKKKVCVSVSIQIFFLSKTIFLHFLYLEMNIQKYIFNIWNDIIYIKSIFFYNFLKIII